VLLTTVQCHVLGAEVTRVTDLEGTSAQIICPEYEKSSGLCRLRREALSGGPLSRLLERAAERTLAQRSSSCLLR
jgi:hypothetical protein